MQSYKDPSNETKPTNFFVLAGIQLRPFEKFGSGCFEMVMANGERRYMQAPSRVERDEWIRCLHDAGQRRPYPATSPSPATTMAFTTSPHPALQAAILTNSEKTPTNDGLRKSPLPMYPACPTDELKPALHRQQSGEVAADLPAGLKNVKLTPDSFDFHKVLGKGNYGKVRILTFQHIYFQNCIDYTITII